MTQFQILSLDGGGIKGIFSAAVLAALEEDLRISITEHFDLIAGTSTGGIIAIALGLGLRPREIVEFYLEEGPKIFPTYCGLKKIQHLFMRKFSPEPLEMALKKCFGEKRFGDSNKRLVIPSYNLGEDDVYIFRTPHDRILRHDYKVCAWKVAKATCAAPTFFPCAKDVENQRLIDGGVWANNPSLVALTEAVSTLRIPLGNLRLFSIGTSLPVSVWDTRLDNGGVISWTQKNAAMEIVLRGQSIGINNQVKMLLGKENVLRLDPKVAAGVFSLDGVKRVDELIAKAAHHSRGITSNFADRYAIHMSLPYEPLYVE